MKIDAETAVRWRVIRLIHERDGWGLLSGMGMYVITAASLAVAAVLLHNDLAFVQESGLAVMDDPLLFPFYVATLVVALFLALSSLATVAREREQGTLLVLFYGPVDEVGYILGKYLAQMVICVIMLGTVLIVLVIWAWGANLYVGSIIVWAAFLALACAGAIVGGGLLLSVVASNVRAALLVFMALAALFLGVQVGGAMIAGAAGSSGPLLFLRDALLALGRVLGLVSPFAYLNRGFDALASGYAGEYMLCLVAAFLFAVLTVCSAALALQRQGVL